MCDTKAYDFDSDCVWKISDSIMVVIGHAIFFPRVLDTSFSFLLIYGGLGFWICVLGLGFWGGVRFSVDWGSGTVIWGLLAFLELGLFL